MQDHSETLQLDFDSELIGFGELAGLFWAAHDPTEQAHGRQFRAALLYSSSEQRELGAELGRRRAAALGGPLRTEIEPLGAFTNAEDYHQKYYLRGRTELMAPFAGLDAVAFTDSTAAARLNAIAGGHGSLEEVEGELLKLELGDQVWRGLKEMVRARNGRRQFFRSR